MACVTEQIPGKETSARFSAGHIRCAETLRCAAQAAGGAPAETMVKSMDRLMQLATFHAWSRQDAIITAAEQSLAQTVNCVGAGATSDIPGSITLKYCICLSRCLDPSSKSAAICR